MGPVLTHQTQRKTILIAEHSGFCYGVKMAVDKAFALAVESTKPVYVLGDLIHNPQVIEKLQEQGVQTVQSVADIPAGSACLIRTHGVDPQHIQTATDKAVDVSDATCPDVRRVQEHPEVVGIMAHAREISNHHMVAVNTPEALLPALEGLPKTRIGIVSQTTQKEETFYQVVALAAQVAKELKVFNTICPATHKRQDAAERLAHQVDLMIVIGGKMSSNTTHLAELCEDVGTPAIHVETVDALRNHPALETAQVIGVTAGASTPDFLVDEVVAYLQTL